MANYANLKLENQLCFALYAATNSIIRFYNARLESVGLTYPQYLVLIVLWEHDGIPVKRLSKLLKLDSSSLTPILKRLEKMKFVERRRSTQDERVVNLFLAGRAHDVKRQVARIQKAVACQTGLPTHEFIDLRDKLGELANAINANSGVPKLAA